MSLFFYNEDALPLDIIEDIKETMRMNYMEEVTSRMLTYEQVLLMLEHHHFNIYKSTFESNGQKITDIIIYRHPDKGIVIEDIYYKIDPPTIMNPKLRIPEENKYIYILNENIQNPSNIEIECIAKHLIFKELKM